MINPYFNNEYEARINVFPYKNQIAFSCKMEDENIQILLYNKTDLMNDSYIIDVSCVNNNELSKLYFNDNKNYLLYPCLKDCSNIKLENDIDCLKKRIEEEKQKEKIMHTIKIIIIIFVIIIIIITHLIVLITIIRKIIKNNSFEGKWEKGKENENEKLMKDILSDLIPN